MKVAVIGGGLTGLTASYYLAKEGYKVTIFEKENYLGGIASGFRESNWGWYLDKTYRHVFSCDNYFLNFCEELGVSDKMIFKEPETASLYEIGENSNIYRTFPVDTPQDFMKLPILKLPEKIRTAFVLAFLKLSPFLSIYEKQTAEVFLKKTMGYRVWEILWEELFRKKFGKYAENILTSFIWARIKKRTKSLGYYQGGFQEFINILEIKNNNLSVEIKKQYPVKNIKKNRGGFVINNKEKYDVIISTLPTPILIDSAFDILPNYYVNRLKKIKYLWSLTQIIVTKTPLFKKAYWVNVNDKNIPIMGIIQHTNYMDKKNYNNNNILYIGNYVDKDDKRLKMESIDLLDFYLPYLKQINTKYKIPDAKHYLYKFPFSQPIFNKEFLKNKPDFTTPVDNFFIANLDMTYPYDRGSNYAVLLAKKVTSLL